jgi:hypothetical protein
VRAGRPPVPVIDDLQQKCPRLGPENHLDDCSPGYRCAVSVIDNVRRGLVDGQHQIGLDLGRNLERPEPPTDLMTDQGERAGPGRPDSMPERRGVNVVLHCSSSTRQFVPVRAGDAGDERDTRTGCPLRSPLTWTPDRLPRPRVGRRRPAATPDMGARVWPAGFQVHVLTAAHLTAAQIAFPDVGQRGKR